MSAAFVVESGAGLARTAGRVGEEAKTVGQSVLSVLRRLLPVFLLLLYSLLGGLVFHMVEGGAEEERLAQAAAVEEASQREATRHLALVHSSRTASVTAQHRTTVEVLNWYCDKIGPTGNSSEKLWGFWGATFYSITLYTTIGYGYQVPTVVEGRVATCVYALVGIPLCLYALVELGWLFSLALRKSFALCRRLRGCLQRRSLMRSREEDLEEEGETSEEEDSLLHFPVSVLVLVTLAWMLICAAAFRSWEEDWDFSTSLYFAFISFSTIGLGDVNPSNHALMISASVLVLIGLALVSTVITVIQQNIEAILKGLKEEAEREAQRQLIEGDAEGDQPPKETSPRPGVSGLAKRVGGGSWLVAALPKDRVAAIEKTYAKRAGRRSAGTQTVGVGEAVESSYPLGLLEAVKAKVSNGTAANDEEKDDAMKTSTTSSIQRFREL